MTRGPSRPWTPTTRARFLGGVIVAAVLLLAMVWNPAMTP